MKTRLVALVAVLCVVLFVRWKLWPSKPPPATAGLAGTEQTDDDTSPSSGEPATAAEGARQAAEKAGDPAARRRPVVDRAAADRMREKLRAIFAEAGIPWGRTPDAPAADASAGAYPTMPTLPPEDGGSEPRVDPKYIQQRVRDDFFPLAKDCYDKARARTPGLGGKVELDFTIMGDPSVGGVVGEATLGKDTTIADAEMQTCIRESLMSTTFAAPPAGGEVTVVYPITFSDDDE